jgi:transcriptional regulator with XRE-family HTH domain
MPRKKNSRGDFGRLLRDHRQRLGLTINELARRIPIDPGHISKIERSLRPPPEIVPTIQRIGEALGFEPDSAEFRELVETAYRERFPRKQKGGISAILTVLPSGRSRAGLSGLSPQAIPPDFTLPPTGGIPFPKIPAEAAKTLLDVSGTLAAAPTGDLLLPADWLTGGAVPRGCRASQFSWKDDTFAFTLHLPSGSDYRIEGRISRSL